MSDVKIEISQKLNSSSEATGLRVDKMYAQTVSITTQAKPNSFQDSFCSLIEWIFEKSDYCSLKKLHPDYAKEIIKSLQQIKLKYENNQKLDYTDTEIKVLDIALNFCHYYLNSSVPRTKEFKKFTKSDYYFYLENLIIIGENIRVASIKLSSLIKSDDTKMSELVQKLEIDN